MLLSVRCDEFERERILAFFIVFSFFSVMFGEIWLLGESGSFMDDELEFGLLLVSFGVNIDEVSSFWSTVQDKGEVSGAISKDRSSIVCSCSLSIWGVAVGMWRSFTICMGCVTMVLLHVLSVFELDIISRWAFDSEFMLQLEDVCPTALHVKQVRVSSVKKTLN